MTGVGIIGLGVMGLTHLDVYRRHPQAVVVALCDNDPKVLSGQLRATGNIAGQAARGAEDLEAARRYADFRELLADPGVELVDICLPTDLHVSVGISALAAGKHLLVEKPLARSSAEAAGLLTAARRAPGMAMVAHCMRFWPGWTWLREAIHDQRFGQLLAATFRRVVAHPGGPFYSSGDRCGGAILDLHIHDTDFIQFCLGMPRAVTSFGYSRITGRPDHVVTRYEYDRVPLVVAEGSWALAHGFRFSMSYCANFQQATAVYDSTARVPLTLVEPGQPPRSVELPSGMGYEHEIAYFLHCIQQGRQPTVVTLQEALQSVRIVEAEVESLTSGRRVELDGQPSS